MGRSGRAVSQKIDYVEETILIKKRKANTNKKYFLSSPKMVSATQGWLPTLESRWARIFILEYKERIKE